MARPPNPKKKVRGLAAARQAAGLVSVLEPYSVVEGDQDSPSVVPTKPVALPVEALDFGASGEDIQKAASKLRHMAMGEIAEILVAWRQDPRVIKTSLDAAKTIVQLAGGTPIPKAPGGTSGGSALERVANALLGEGEQQ